jgi:hypothetical protein
MASKSRVDPDVAIQQVKKVKEISEQLAAQAFNMKMMGQNAKKYKTDSVSFANRIQISTERTKEFVKKIEEEPPEIIAMKYNLEDAIEELEKSRRKLVYIAKSILRNN